MPSDLETHIALPQLAIERHRLDNGLEVVLHRDPGLPLVAVNLWYHVGSKHESPGRTGLAHLFEHMLFQGSKHIPENGHFSHVQQVGGVANGSTWYDRTNYFETLPSDSLDLGLWLESDRMGFLLPAMTAEKLGNQRDVVMNERRQRVDNQPYGRASERLSELLFPSGHPYHWPVIGTMEDIAAATLKDVEEFFRTWYVPDNAVLTLAGDFDAARALDSVQRYFGDLPPGGERPPLDWDSSLVDAGDDPVETLTDNVQLERSTTAYRIPAYGDRSWYAADLLGLVLAGGKASLLHRDLVYRRELAHAVHCFALPTEETGAFYVVATARPGVDAERLEVEVAQHLERIAAEGPSEGDVARAHRRLLSAYFAELQTLARRADLLSMHTTYFDAPERLEDEIRILLSLGPADLQGFVADYCTPGRRARIRVVPVDQEPS